MGAGQEDERFERLEGEVADLRAQLGEVSALLRDPDTTHEAESSTERMGRIEALVVDDVEVADDLGLTLSDLAAPLLYVVGCITRPDDAVSTVMRTQPDVVICRLRDPVARETMVAELVDRFEGLRVIVLLYEIDAEPVWRTLASGAGGVLRASVSPRQLALGIIGASDHVIALPASVALPVARDVAEGARLREGLDDADIELWRHLARGEADHTIAARLHVSERTVKRRIRTLLRQLDVANRVQAAVLAGRYRLKLD